MSKRLKSAPLPPQRRETFWVDVRDHLPDDEMTVLVATRADDGEVTLAWHCHELWRDCGSGSMLSGVTHWMDIPEGPAS